MQLRLVIILLLWFGCLDNDVGRIENWNIIYLLFLFFVFLLLLLLLLFIYFLLIYLNFFVLQSWAGNWAKFIS